MPDYEPPPPEHAEFIRSQRAESAAQSARLADAAPDTAWQIASDTSESDAARLQAVLILLRAKDSRMPDLVLSLFDEPNTSIWRTVIESVQTDDPRIRQRLHERLTSDSIEDAATALFALARMHDASVVGVCRQWLNEGQEQRNAAVEILRVLKTEDAIQTLSDRWSETLTDEDKATLAVALVEFEHAGAIEYADQLAEQAQDGMSVAAAIKLYLCREQHGLTRMRHILQTGHNDAKRMMVSQISSLCQTLPNAYTAEGIHEAMQWVDSELAKFS